MSAIVNYFLVLPSPASLILLLLCLTGRAKLAFWTEYVGGSAHCPAQQFKEYLYQEVKFVLFRDEKPQIRTSQHCLRPIAL